MQNNNEKKYYSPQFSPLASISVRRFAWAVGKSMPAAVEIMVKLLPHMVDTAKICLACKDNTKCQSCVFTTQHQPTEDQIAVMAAL